MGLELIFVGFEISWYGLEIQLWVWRLVGWVGLGGESDGQEF